MEEVFKCTSINGFLMASHCIILTSRCLKILKGKIKLSSSTPLPLPLFSSSLLMLPQYWSNKYLVLPKEEIPNDSCSQICHFLRFAFLSSPSLRFGLVVGVYLQCNWSTVLCYDKQNHIIFRLEEVFVTTSILVTYYSSMM